MVKKLYKAATYFPEEVREKVAEKVFVRNGSSFLCENGDCVVGALLRAMKPADEFMYYWHQVPSPNLAIKTMVAWGILDEGDITSKNRMMENIGTLMRVNDSGALQEPAAVKAALLGKG